MSTWQRRGTLVAAFLVIVLYVGMWVYVIRMVAA
jgi:hypothetical protein